ncbi:hypothetical protein, partial [Plasmodium yoelii yoelii]
MLYFCFIIFFNVFYFSYITYIFHSICNK